jgi:hypothetical protein
MSTLVNIISIFMAVCAGILGIISYIPGIKDWLDISTPSLSHYFLATILIVLTSKFITLYLILHWRTSPEYTEQSLHNIFIWSYFVSMMMGIFVYFNFAIGQQKMKGTLDLMDKVNNDLSKLIDKIKDISDETKQKALADKVEDTLNFLKKMNEQAKRFSGLLLEDANTLKQYSPEFQDKVDSDVKSAQQKFEKGVLMVQDMTKEMSSKKSEPTSED